MVHNSNTNIIFNYYQQLLRLRHAQSFLRDIEKLSIVVDNFTPERASNILKRTITKYKPSLNEIGRHLTGISVIKKHNVYEHKTPNSLFNDLLYLVRCIIIIGAVQVGLEKSLYEAIKKVKEENLNLYSIDLKW